MEYFILIDGKQIGPIALDKMKEHGVTGNTLVWRHGMDDWKPAGLVPEVAELLRQTPPPLPPEVPPVRQPEEKDEETVEEFGVEEPSFRKYLKYVIPICLLAVMLFTCPDDAKHRDVISKKITASVVLDSSEFEPGMRMLGTFFMPAITEMVLNGLFSVSNYGIVSVGTVDGTPVSVGIFGHVFILQEDKLTGEQIYKWINGKMDKKTSG